MNDTDETELDREIMAAAARLDMRVAPQRDLWPAIEQAIAEPARQGGLLRHGLLAQAAAVVLLVGSSSALTYFAVSGDSSGVAPTVPVATLEFEPVAGSFGSQYYLGPDFQDARSDLEAKLAQELDALPAEVRADVEQNLATIRAAMAELNKALDAEPDNRLLQDLLLSAYREELAVMKRVDGKASSVMRRNDI